MPPAPRMNLSSDSGSSAPNTPSETAPPAAPPADHNNHNNNNINMMATTTNNTTPSPTYLNTNALDDSEYNPDHLSQSTIKCRARSHWNFVKSLHVTQKQNSQSYSCSSLFKMGEKISLTTAEATFLNMVTKSRLEGDSRRRVSANGGSPRSVGARSAAATAAAAREEIEGESNGTNSTTAAAPEPRDALAVSGRTHFSHLVQAAVAKERLRDSISARLVSLSGAEAKFLSKLVTNKDVTLEALENAVHVLDNDPLYNPSLRTKTDFISDFNVGVIDEEDEESGAEGEEDEGAKMTARDMRGKLQRRDSAIQSSALFDKAMGLDDSVRETTGVMEMSENRRKNYPRRSSSAESSVWMIATGPTDEKEEEDVDSISEEGEEEDHDEDEAHDAFPSSIDPLELSMHSQGAAKILENMMDLDESQRSSWVGGLDESTRSRAAGAGLDASTRSRARRASNLEQNMWRMAQQTDNGGQNVEGKNTGDADPDSSELDESTRANMGGRVDRLSQSVRSPRTRRTRRATTGFEPGSGGGGSAVDRLSQSSRLPRKGLGRNKSRRASAMEQSMWKLVHGDSIDENDPAMAEKLEQVEDEHGLPVKSTNAGEAMDPLLMAAPVEMTPMTRRKKSLGDADDDEEGVAKAENERNVEDKRVDLDRLLSSKAQLKVPPTLPGAPAPQSVTYIDASQDVQASLSICCGMEGMLLDAGIINDLTPDVNDNNPDAEEKEEEDSLASKKRYLHLNSEKNETATETNNQHEHLSTWMGAPEDYPILGLEKKGAGGEDPLEPHVLSPLLMKCLRDHFPYALREENFWLKYSLVRDGASLDAIFSIMRHSQHSVLAIETSTGKVFGSFTSSPWRANGNNYYGSCEAFVWMLRKSRLTADGEESCQTLDEYILRESTLDVSKWNGKDGNRNVQLSNQKKLFVGGGNPDSDAEEMSMQSGRSHSNPEEKDDAVQWGMALALDKDLLRGTSSRCATFSSNPLIGGSCQEGSEVFEIMNMEIWALTPCMNEETAEELELGRAFVMGFHKQS